MTPIVTDNSGVVEVVLKGSYQTPDGKYSLNTSERRFRTADDSIDVEAFTGGAWESPYPILATLTLNPHGRVIAIEKHGEA